MSGALPQADRAVVNGAASVSAVPASIPSADYIAVVAHSRHEKYSPNIHRWLSREAKRWPTPLSVGFGPNPANGARDWLFIGWRDEDDGWFMGSAVATILRNGKATCFAHPPGDIIDGPADFWTEYLADGRCALDRTHRRWFLNADGRFSENGDDRQCLWCGAKQHRTRWTETVERERWEPAQGIEAGTDETPQEVRPEGQEPDPVGDAPTLPDQSHTPGAEQS